VYKENYHKQQWLFVGEQRSPRAKLLGLTWEDVALCSKTLHNALRALDLQGTIHFVNLWDDTGEWTPGVIP
jgi:hypothetical protein